jgi:hypothetical protein
MSRHSIHSRLIYESVDKTALEKVSRTKVTEPVGSFFVGCGAAEAQQRGQPQRGHSDDGHEPHQDSHHRLQSAHPETGKMKVSRLQSSP